MKLNQTTVIKAAQSDNNIGFCVGCGKRHTEVEPDAEKYPCEKCKKKTVYGAEQICLMFF